MYSDAFWMHCGRILFNCVGLEAIRPNPTQPNPILPNPHSGQAPFPPQPTTAILQGRPHPTAARPLLQLAQPQPTPTQPTSNPAPPNLSQPSPTQPNTPQRPDRFSIPTHTCHAAFPHHTAATRLFLSASRHATPQTLFRLSCTRPTAPFAPNIASTFRPMVGVCDVGAGHPAPPRPTPPQPTPRQATPPHSTPPRHTTPHHTTPHHPTQRNPTQYNPTQRNPTQVC